LLSDHHLQNGIRCLTLIIRKDCGQVLSWADASGRSGLDNILNILAKLLQSQDESGGLVIGDLIIHLFRKSGETILPVLPELLQAMVARMTSAKTATFIQVNTSGATSVKSIDNQIEPYRPVCILDSQSTRYGTLSVGADEC
jgi:hypothetical protein